MFKFRISTCILLQFVKVAIIISAEENDPQTENSKNLNVYLVTSPELTELLPDPARQYQEEIPAHPTSEYEVKQQKPDDQKIVLKVLPEDQKTLAVHSSRENKPDLTQSDIPQIVCQKIKPEYTKYELKAEEPKEESVFIKVLPEGENEPDGTHSNTPQIAYQKIKPEYAKYELKGEELKDKNVFIQVHPEVQQIFLEDSKHTVHNNSEIEYKKIYEKVREVENGKQNVFPKVARKDRNPIVLKPAYYLEQDYRKSAAEYRKSEPDYIKYKTKREEPKVFVNVDKEDKKSFEVDPKYKTDHLKRAYEKPITKHRNSEPDHRDPRKEYKRDDDEKHKEKQAIFEVIKEDKKISPVDPKYQNVNSNFEPVNGKSVTKYRRSPQLKYKETEVEVKKYEDVGDGINEKKVFINVVKEHEKTFDVSPKYRNENKYLEPEYRLSKSDYDKYELKKTIPKEDPVFVTVAKEDRKPHIGDSTYKNDNTDFNSELRKPIIKYQKPKPKSEYVRSGRGYDKLDALREEHKIKVIFDGDSRYESENKYIESKYKKLVPKYEESESEYHRAESDYDKYDDNQERTEGTKETKSSDEDVKYKNDYIYYEPDYMKTNTNLAESELKSNRESEYGEPKHDVIVKIWTRKS